MLLKGRVFAVESEGIRGLYMGMGEKYCIRRDKKRERKDLFREICITQDIIT